MPARFFGKDMTEAERKEVVMKAYERLKVSLDKFLKPDGSKEAPAKTCADIKYHHPDFESGKLTNTTFLTKKKRSYKYFGERNA